MKPISWVILALIVLGGAYYWYSGQQQTGQAVTVPASGSSATEGTTGTVSQEAKDAVSEAVEGAADKAESVAGQAAEAVESAVESATEAASEAVDSASESATDAVNAASDAASDAAAAATEAGTEAAQSVAGGASAVGDLLSVENFNLEKVIEAVDASELSAVQKTTLKTGLEKAKDNPELLQGILDQVKAALGL